jgi:F-type H+-transporting ATPase subunit c
MKKLMLGVWSALLVSLYSLVALAQTPPDQPVGAVAQAASAASNEFDRKSWAMIAAAIAIGVAVFGGALGQGRIGSAALEGIARNPSASNKITTPMILGLALVESLVLFALVISFLLYGKA